jgi:hypothetical protein
MLNWPKPREHWRLAAIVRGMTNEPNIGALVAASFFAGVAIVMLHFV